MKIKLSLLFVFCFGTIIISNAQLLKKLKDKAASVIAPTKTTTNSTNQDNNAAASTTTKETKAPAKPPSYCNVIFSLAGDETLLYDETEIISQNNKVSYSFVVTNKKREFFLIENGNRTGPFKESPLKSRQTSEDEESSSGPKDDAISMGGDNKDAVALKYTKTIDGKLYIVFNGKNYGAYDYVAKMIVSSNKKQFFALVTIGAENAMMAKMGMGYSFMVNEAGLKQKVGNSGMAMPARFSVSQGFKHCMATVIDQQAQKVLTVSSTGKQDESSMADMYASNVNASFVNDNGDIISVPSQSPTQVLVNGKEAASFKVPIKNMNRLFLTPDISKSVYYEKGKLYRADGSEEALSGVVFPRVITTGNETAVYYFLVYKNDNGVKDVYLCKKII